VRSRIKIAKGKENKMKEMSFARKKLWLNITMVVAIVVIIVSGIMAAGSLQGWFSEESRLVSASKTGNVNIQRNGIAYSLKDGLGIKNGDIIETKGGSEVSLNIDDIERVILNENTEITVAETKSGIVIEVTQGELLADYYGLDDGSAFTVGANSIMPQNAVISISFQAGAKTVFVYSGTVSVSGDPLTGECEASAGQVVMLLETSGGKTEASVSDMSITSLNSFQIAQMQKIGKEIELCFTNDELDKVITDREEELRLAQQELLENGRQMLGENGDETTAAPSSSNSAGDTGSTQALSVTDGSGAGGQGTQTQSPANTTAPSDAPEPSDATEPGTTPTPKPSANATPKPSVTPTPKKKANTCTISIRCDTILDNMGDLTEGKDKYVPANGVILATSTIEFEDGETVFDVLKGACSLAGIQLEYSWTPMYNSYYIEGINHLYEFDCGEQSGWMYKVNGWFPNYGCSSYTLNDGDVIVWCYTCKGLGADVGGSVY
jgi:type II secretory pathway pseudopilin PulG